MTNMVTNGYSNINLKGSLLDRSGFTFLAPNYSGFNFSSKFSLNTESLNNFLY